MGAVVAVGDPGVQLTIKSREAPARRGTGRGEGRVRLWLGSDTARVELRDLRLSRGQLRHGAGPVVGRHLQHPAEVRAGDRALPPLDEGPSDEDAVPRPALGAGDDERLPPAEQADAADESPAGGGVGSQVGMAGLSAMRVTSASCRAAH